MVESEPDGMGGIIIFWEGCPTTTCEGTADCQSLAIGSALSGGPDDGIWPRIALLGLR